MTFRDYIFLERDDKEKIEQISNICEDVLKQLEVYYFNLFKIYFPFPKEVKDHEKFMDWRSACRKYEHQFPKYAGRFISIQSGSTSLGGDLKGEYLDNKIYIYDKEFSKLLQELKNHHHSYEYNLRGNPISRIIRQNVQIKKEAKLIHEKMIETFKNNEQNYLSTLFHEIVHLFDHDKIGDKFDKVTQNATDKLNKEIDRKPLQKTKIYNNIYMNSDIETNAWFLTKAHQVLSKQFINFQDLLKDFKSSFGDHWLLITQSKQKKMINRLFQIFNK